jgi:hypothetical protein
MRKIQDLISTRSGDIVVCSIFSNLGLAIVERSPENTNAHYHLCQNMVSGNRPENLHGMNFGWSVAYGNASNLRSNSTVVYYVVDKKDSLEKILRSMDLLKEERDKEYPDVLRLFKKWKIEVARMGEHWKRKGHLYLPDKQQRLLKRVCETDLTLKSKVYMCLYLTREFGSWDIPEKIFSSNDKVHTTPARRRSSGDIYRHLLSVMEVKLEDVIEAMYGILGKKVFASIHPSFRITCSFCSTVKRMVFYGHMSPSIPTKGVDEYRGSLLYWKIVNWTNEDEIYSYLLKNGAPGACNDGNPLKSMRNMIELSYNYIREMEKTAK